MAVLVTFASLETVVRRSYLVCVLLPFFPPLCAPTCVLFFLDGMGFGLPTENRFLEEKLSGLYKSVDTYLVCIYYKYDVLKICT